MNAHELGRRLLAGEDLPVVIAKPDMGDREEVFEVAEHAPDKYGWADSDCKWRDDRCLEIL